MAGGGSGGHICPGLAVAQEVVKRGGEVVFVCTERTIDEKILGGSPYEYVKQPVVPMPRRVGDVWKFYRYWKESVRICREVLGDGKSAAVLGLGGFASGPMLKTAAKMRVPIGMLNPDAVPGKANRLGCRYANKIFVQWQESQHYFKRYGDKVVVTGCPIRAEIAQAKYSRQEARKELGLKEKLRTLVVVGGSLGGHNVNLAVAEALAGSGAVELDGWQVLHITGADDGEWVRQRYEKSQVPAAVVAFSDRMDLVLSAAELVIGRAGASTLAELTAREVPSILLPYPYHKDQHQLINASVLSDVQAALIVADSCDAVKTAKALREALCDCLSARRKQDEGDEEVLAEKLTDESQLEMMSEAARGLGRPEAATTVADELMQLVYG